MNAPATTIERAAKERGIPFSGPMVRAILAGSKTQTRRLIKSPAKTMQRMGAQVIAHREPGDSWYGDHVWSMRDRHGVWNDYTHERFLALCPYGVPGDRLYVREAWRMPQHLDALSGAEAAAVMLPPVQYEADRRRRHWAFGARPGHTAREGWVKGEREPGRYRQARFMPRWASRITLEVTGVRVERLQAITPDDVIAEGVPMVPRCSCEACSMSSGWCPADASEQVLAFASLWDEINGERASWESNPWVWCVSFRRVEG